MKIRVRLLSLFLVLFGTLLFAFAAYIYYSASQNRKNGYYEHLKREAMTKANMLFDAHVPPEVLQLIYKTSDNSLFEEEVAIYDTSFQLLYHDAVYIDKVKETRSMIDNIISEGEIRFLQDDFQVIGFTYKHNNVRYVITAAASDKAGIAYLSDLKYSLVFSLIVIIGLSAIAGYYFVGKVLDPVGKIVDKVEDITATNLDMRVPVGNEKDEIGELAITFNNMLDRLENSFNAQKNFVSNISHELRTPLSTLVGELELALSRQRDPDMDAEVMKAALLDAHQLAKLSNDLLDLAKASYDQSEVAKKKVRIDELLLDARGSVIKGIPGYQVDISFAEEAGDLHPVSLNGNEYLLRVAFANLMDNACKFSEDHRCWVTISPLENDILIRFIDRGIGISEADIPLIFTDFYRGENKAYTPGNGIGLSLTRKIIRLHGGTIQVASTGSKGSTFEIHLPRS